MQEDFVKTPLQNVLTITHIVTLHHFRYAPNFLFTGERHDFWEMAYVESGTVGVMAEAEGYTLHTGEAIFHKPGEYHNIWASGKEAYVVILAFCCDSPHMDFFKNKILSFDVTACELISCILQEGKETFSEPLDILYQKKLIKNKTARFGSEQLLKSNIEMLLLHLIRINSTIPNTERSSKLRKSQNEQLIVDSIISFLRENLSQALQLDDVCANICFSKTYLKRLFKDKTGFSIMEYYNNLKIERAKRLLEAHELTITEIAEILGYRSIHYFSRIFKQKTGFSPSQYLTAR